MERVAGGSPEPGASSSPHPQPEGGGIIDINGNGNAQSSSGGDTAAAPGGSRVLIYGGYSGESVEGDLLQIDGRTLEIELVRRGPRESDRNGTVPTERFAHSAALVPTGSEGTSAGGPHAMVVFGGVNPKEDLSDVAVWVLG